MPVGKWWVDYTAQSLLHALVAALAVEAMLRMWRARAPDDRLSFRLLGLGQPLLVTPALFLLVPQRRGEDFHDRWALLASRHWEDLVFHGLTAFHVALALGAVLGAALFLMDLLPVLRGRRGELPPRAPAPDGLAAAFDDECYAQRLPPPALHFVESGAVMLFCTGWRRPTVVVSRGALELLDGAELRGALAHEIGHLARRDPALSWVLMGARALLFFNPVAQVVARALARDAEWRADERAADRLALASALIKLHRAGSVAPSRALAANGLAPGSPFRSLRSHDVAARCRRLIEPSPPPRLALRPLRLALACAVVVALASVIV